MLAVEIRWEFEKYFSVLKVIGTAKMCNIILVDDIVQSHLISKMLEVIKGAEAFEGRVLDIEPSI